MRARNLIIVSLTESKCLKKNQSINFAFQETKQTNLFLKRDKPKKALFRFYVFLLFCHLQFFCMTFHNTRRIIQMIDQRSSATNGSTYDRKSVPELCTSQSVRLLILIDSLLYFSLKICRTLASLFILVRDR